MGRESKWGMEWRSEVVGVAGYGRRMRHAVLDDWLLSLPQTPRERRRGLLGRQALHPCEALVLADCRSVHTVGMRFAIDVVLLDRGWRTLRVVRMTPRRILLPRPGARHVVEVAAGRGCAFSQALDGRTTRRMQRIVR